MADGERSDPSEPGACGRAPGLARVLLPLLAALALAVALALRHRGLYGDAPLFAELWNQGVWVFAHFLTFPLARVVQALGSVARPLDGIEALRLTSALAAAVLVAATYLRAARTHGPVAAACAALCVGAAPSFLLFCGAAEVHATAAAAVALGALLATWPVARTGRALMLACVGYALACAGHVTCTLLGPAFLLLHLARERESGRRLTRRHAAFAALALLLAGLAVIDGIVLLEGAVRRFGWLFPRGASSPWEAVDVAAYSALERYLSAMVRWTDVARGPSWALQLFGELATPLGILGLLACAGLLPALRRQPGAAVAHLVWIGALAYASLRVGAREYGAYLLPALPACAWFAAAAFARFARGRAGLVLVAWVLSLGLGLWAVDTFHGGRRLEARGGAERVPAGDLGLPVPGAFAALGSEPPEALSDERAEDHAERLARHDRRAAFLLGLAALVAALSGLERRPARGAVPASRRGAAFALAFLCLGTPAVLGARAFLARWPELTKERASRLGERVAEWRGPRDVLLLASPVLEGHVVVEWHWTMNHEVGRHGAAWIDLGLIDTAADAAEVRAVTGTMNERLVAVRAAGGRVLVPDDTIGLLQATQRAIALEYLRDLFARGAAERRPLTGLYPFEDAVAAFDAPH